MCTTKNIHIIDVVLSVFIVCLLKVNLVKYNIFVKFEFETSNFKKQILRLRSRKWLKALWSSQRENNVRF